MKISIITVVYNNQATIEGAIKSVINQSYKNIEYIIIDGNSTDGTMDVINKYTELVSKLISENDNGLYDAMNKGINLATGEIIGILNSDDFYANNTIIEKVVTIFKNSGCDSLYGNLDFISAKNPSKIIRHWKSSKFKKDSFTNGWHPPHPTFFVRRHVYEKYGLFDTSFNVSADFELMLRFFEKWKITSYYLDEIVVKMRYGGESTRYFKKIVEGNLNVLRAFKKNRIPISKFYFLKRGLLKIKQLRFKSEV